jgi:hypothetical protein
MIEKEKNQDDLILKDEDIKAKNKQNSEHWKNGREQKND